MDVIISLIALFMGIVMGICITSYADVALRFVGEFYITRDEYGETCTCVALNKDLNEIASKKYIIFEVKELDRDEFMKVR